MTIFFFKSVHFHVHGDNTVNAYYITMHMNMHGDIMYCLSNITMYIHIHGDITILSNLSPCISLYTTFLDTGTRKSWR